MRTLFFIPFAVLLSFLAGAQTPVNDNCAGILNLGEVPYCSQPAQFTNLNATASNIDPNFNIPTCWSNLAERDVWFQFSLPPDGSITELTLSIWGNIAGNGTMRMPQMAVYRGDCAFGGLAELACATAPLNVNELQLDLFGLDPSVPYFLRVNDYSATASPNWGTFKLCIEPYEPEINMGDLIGSPACSGTLWDSGGPLGNYQNNENLSFAICPTEPHQCIRLNFEFFNVEATYDFIYIYEGNGTNGNLIKRLDGSASNVVVQSDADCVTIAFRSDETVTLDGFKLSWLCSPEICDAPPPSLPPNATCDKAININSCSNQAQILPLSPGVGDPNFLQQGINQGCIAVASNDLNFSFFYFQAQADGKFGFTVQSANPADAADIDFNIWGPMANEAEICDFVSNNQPIRSSWDDGQELAGLSDIHPTLGTPVLDDFDCGSPATPGTDPPNGPDADDFVRRIDVLTGEIYVIMLDDYNGSIEEDGIVLDLSGTSDGVLGPIISPITFSNDTSSCDGSPVQLMVNGGLSYAWSPNAGLNCNTCPSPTANPEQTTTYVVTAAGVCQEVTDSITVFLPPSLSLIADTSICVGQSIALAQHSPVPGTFYSWTPKDGSLDDADSANPIATPVKTTTYTLVASSGTCTETRTVTIAVVDVMLNVSPSDTSLCQGQSAVITAAVSPANTPLSWAPQTGLQVLPDGLHAVATPSESIAYEITAAVPGCTNIQIVSIRVDSLPEDLSIHPADTMVCAGEQVLLVSPPYSGANYPGLAFSWQTQAGQVLPETAYFFLANPAESTAYMRISRNGACVDTALATVQITPVPALSITPVHPQICLGESVLLEVANAAALSVPQWSPAVGLSCILCYSPTAAPSETTTYTFSANTVEGCATSATVTVEVNSPAQFQFPSDTLCAGESILLNLVADTTANYSWISIPPGFTSTEAQPTDMPQVSTTYVVTIENGCTVLQQFTVPVLSPGNLMLSDSMSICAGISLELAATGNYPGTYVWSNGQTGQIIQISPTNSATYTVAYTYPLDNPQCQQLDSVFVDVQGEIAAVSLPNDVLLCPGDSIVFNTTATPGATYSWTSNPPIFTSNEAMPPAFFPTESTTITLNTALNACTNTYTFDVTLFNPQMVVSNDTLICAGQPVTIGADAFLTGQYFWSPGGTAATFVDTVENATTYLLEFGYGEGCVYHDTVQVGIIPNFSIKIVGDPDTLSIDAGASILLDAVIVPSQNVNGFSFDWFENLVDPIGSGQQITVTANTDQDSVSYTVIAVAPSGCLQEQTVVFRVVQPFAEVPNAFTPNGDNANDSFGLAIIEGIANVETLEIYTRWGERIFSSTDPKARWDGTIQGQPAPSDVYAYVLYWRGGDGALRFSKGEVTLLR